MNPSGEQVELAFGEQRAVLVSAGAGLRTYSVGRAADPRRLRRRRGLPVGAGPAARPVAEPHRGRPLRLRGALAPASAERARGGTRSTARALGALGGRRPRNGPGRVRACALPAARLPVRARAEGRVLALGRRARRADRGDERGSEAAPFGAGWHPYLAVEGDLVDGVELHVPAATVLVADERGLPTSSGPVADEAWTSASRGRSGRQGSTTASPTSSETTAAGPPRASAGPPSGSTRASRT